MKNLSSKTNLLNFLFAFMIVALLAMGIFLLIFAHSIWENYTSHNYNIDSFAGCFNEGKSTWTSYEKLSEDQFNESIKTLDITKKEFEKRKNRCIKAGQLESFAGCKGMKEIWKRWDEMNEQEFKESLKYFDVDEETFNNIKKLCDNHNLYVK